MKVFDLLLRSFLIVLSIVVVIVMALAAYYSYQKYTVSDETKKKIKEMLMQDISLNKDIGVIYLSNEHEVLNQNSKEFILPREVVIKGGKDAICFVLLDEVELSESEKSEYMISKLIGTVKISVNAVDINGDIYNFDKQSTYWRALGKVNEENKLLGELSLCIYQGNEQRIPVGTILYSFHITSSDIVYTNKIYWREDAWGMKK